VQQALSSLKPAAKAPNSLRAGIGMKMMVTQWEALMKTKSRQLKRQTMEMAGEDWLALY